MGLMVLGSFIGIGDIDSGSQISESYHRHMRIFWNVWVDIKRRGVLEFILRSRFWIVWQREYHSKSRL